MSEFIREVILTTRRADGSPHIAPMGVRERDEQILVSPFRPSTTLENLLREGCAVVNMTDDVRVYAGCLTGRYHWPVTPASAIDGVRLEESLGHEELVLERVEEDETRPRLFCRVVHRATHEAFRGFNRAQAAVLELAILASRLEMLPGSKIDGEMAYLRTAMDKTAGPRERTAWQWLEERIAEHRQQCA